jgi:class 3 adenylate cyclase
MRIQVMSTSIHTITVLFADVEGSTTIYEKLGDEHANRIINNVIAKMTEVTVQNAGVLVKTIGDEVMCRFGNANNAITAASSIQEMLQKSQAEYGIKIQARIGLHMGQALIRDDGDVFGDAVNIAARVTAIARGGQIITTKDTADSLSPEFQSECREFDRISLKGRSEETVIYDVLWERADDVTRMSTMINFRNARQPEKKIQLKYLGKEVGLFPESSVISLGRGDQCDLVVNSARVSRLHAKIEFRRGKFVIIDQSTNGTFVKSSDGKEVYLRREELPLVGDGVISLGMKADNKNPHGIYYSV